MRKIIRTRKFAWGVLALVLAVGAVPMVGSDAVAAYPPQCPPMC